MIGIASRDTSVHMRTSFLVFTVAAVFHLAANGPTGQAADPMFENAKDCGLPGVKMNCRVWEPANYKAGTKYPLIVYMHGAGQAGYSSNPVQNAKLIENTRNWAAMLLGVVNEESGKTNGEYFVMLPQAPDSETKAPTGGAYVQWDWGQTSSYKLSSTPESPTLRNARAMLDGVQKKYNIDPSRLYGIGSSMGGFGTWDMIARNPTLFAAGLPNANPAEEGNDTNTHNASGCSFSVRTSAKPLTSFIALGYAVFLSRRRRRLELAV